MSGKEHQFLDFVRSGISWVLVAAVTVVFFFLVALYCLLFFAFDPNRKWVQPVVSSWAKTILLVCPLMKVRLEGAERLKKEGTYVFVANHQSLADIIAVLHLKHPFKFIAKKELFWIPFFGWAIRLAGFIPLVRGDQQSGKATLDQARRYLEQKVSVLFFPEGTRSLDGEIKTFKMGAFKLASELDIPVVPLVIDGTRNLIPKGSWLIGRSAQAVAVNIEAPRQPKGKDTSSIELFAGEVRNKMIQRLNQIRQPSQVGFIKAKS